MKSRKMETRDATRIALLEQSMSHTNETMNRIESFMVDSFTHLHARVDRFEKALIATRGLSWSHFRWIMGAIITLFITIVTISMKEIF